MNQERINKKYFLKRKRLRTYMTVFLVSVVSIVLLLGYFINRSFGSIQTKKMKESELGISKEVQNKIGSYNRELRNILIMGIDEPENPGEPQRSDAMMIISIDSQNKVIKMSSLMRDTFVDIPGKFTDKLNHAYVYGGPELTLRTVNSAFDMDIRDYILVDYHNLIQIIESVGGIEIDVKPVELPLLNEAILDINRKELTSVPYVKTAGKQLLNGTQAVGYSRIRRAGPTDSDYHRALRQRYVLKQIFYKMKDMPIYKLPTTASSMGGMVKTTLTTNEMIEIGSQILLDKISTIEESRFPSYNTSKEMNTPRLWYLKYDKEATVEELHNFIYKGITPKIIEKD